MRPARGLLLVRPIEPEETYAGGAIIVPEAARQRLTINQCECVAVGEPEFCDDEDCDRHEVWATWALTGDVNRSDEEALAQRYHVCPVKPGDWLLVRPRSYLETDEPERKRWLVHQRDVLAILHA